MVDHPSGVTLNKYQLPKSGLVPLLTHCSKTLPYFLLALRTQVISCQLLEFTQ
jgi:hypothetical protein